MIVSLSKSRYITAIQYTVKSGGSALISVITTTVQRDEFKTQTHLNAKF